MTSWMFSLLPYVRKNLFISRRLILCFFRPCLHKQLHVSFFVKVQSNYNLHIATRSMFKRCTRALPFTVDIQELVEQTDDVTVLGE